jgi:hypothetical protein
MTTIVTAVKPVGTDVTGLRGSFALTLGANAVFDVTR